MLEADLLDRAFVSLLQRHRRGGAEDRVRRAQRHGYFVVVDVRLRDLEAAARVDDEDRRALGLDARLVLDRAPQRLRAEVHDPLERRVLGRDVEPVALATLLRRACVFALARPNRKRV